MSPPRFSSRVLQALLDGYGWTWSTEAGFAVANTPSRLFRLLCLSLLLSARISSQLSVRGAKALSDQGWTTPAKMLASTWARRARVLNDAGYARFDERTASMLEDVSRLSVDRWKGDLRNLRREADEQPEDERRLLKECEGIGDVGADIFFREVQGIWPEVSPFLDQRALDDEYERLLKGR